MLDLYTFTTPNGRKIPIALAELELPYTLHLVDLHANEQKSEAFLALNPNGKIPALVESDGPGGEPLVIFESGAILEYLAERTGKLISKDPRKRIETLEWLFWQVAGPGPMFGQAAAFAREKPRNEKAFSKFVTESKRLIGVLEARLKGREWIVDEYSIADIACYPWFAAMDEQLPEILEGAPLVRAWMNQNAAREAVRTGMNLGRAA